VLTANYLADWVYGWLDPQVCIGKTKIFETFNSIKSARFWMTFSDNYLNHLKVLENVPLKFLKELLPDQASLGPLTKGRTCIGCYIEGQKKWKSSQNLCEINRTSMILCFSLKVFISCRKIS